MSTLLWFVLLVVVVIVIRSIRKARDVTPPGPPSHPIIGHLLSFPLKDRAARLHELSDVYGDVVYFNILGQKIIVLSSEVAASDLLEKRSAIYSDRPRFPTFNMLGYSDILSFLPYGAAFHRQRKLLQDTLTRSRCIEFQDIQIEHARTLLRQLLEQPNNFVSHVHRFTTSILFEITYGYKIQSDDDEYLKYAQQLDEIAQTAARVTIIDLFPVLTHLPSWFPGAWFTRYARDTQPVRVQMRTVPFELCRSEMDTGAARPCFVSGHLEEMIRNNTDNTKNLYTLSTASMQLWEAGTDTTWAAVLTFILAILVHPEAQHKAQEEIDRVVGSARLPDFSDRESLPYLECLLQECRRWNPNVDLGVPHRVMEDDVYHKMLIPKGSTILVNARALTMDPEVYHNPHEFRPERFLPETGEPYPTGAFFGYGRRICVGRHLAEANIWIAAAYLLAAFDIVSARDEYGQEIVPEVKMIEAIITHPAPFKCEFRPRSREIQKIVEDV